MIFLPHYGEIGGDRARAFADEDDFWELMIEIGWDPIWVWRYIRYRLAGSFFQEVVLLDNNVNLTSVKRVLLKYLDSSCDIEGENKDYDFYVSRFYKSGCSFGYFPRHPYVGEWCPIKHTT